MRYMSRKNILPPNERKVELPYYKVKGIEKNFLNASTKALSEFVCNENMIPTITGGEK